MKQNKKTREKSDHRTTFRGQMYMYLEFLKAKMKGDGL